MKIKAFNKIEIEHAIFTGLLIDILGEKLEPFTSFCKNAIPTAGSPTSPLNKLNQDVLSLQMTGIVLHNTGDFTITSESINIRFWIKQDEALLWLAHANKKQVMNKMVNRKYNCGDLY